MDSYASERWLVTLSAALVVIGMVFFLCGMVATDPMLYRAAVAMKGSILASITSNSPTSLTEFEGLKMKAVFSVSDTPFLIASVLMVMGACLDVWRRLHRLHGVGSMQWSLFDQIDHDPIMDETHVW